MTCDFPTLCVYVICGASACVALNASWSIFKDMQKIRRNNKLEDLNRIFYDHHIGM